MFNRQRSQSGLFRLRQGYGGLVRRSPWGKGGQASMPEYVVTFFIVIGVVVAMATFIQRSYQARIYDGRNYMIKTAISSVADDPNFIEAAGNKISYEYEPYYVKVASEVTRDSSQQTGLLEGLTTGIFRKTLNEQTEVQSTSVQLPPVEAQ